MIPQLIKKSKTEIILPNKKIYIPERTYKGITSFCDNCKIYSMIQKFCIVCGNEN